MVLIEKHFTSTAFVLHPIEDKVLLHWHSKVKAWLPPGGHIENNETPVEAVKRETFEETGIHIKLYNFNSSVVIQLSYDDDDDFFDSDGTCDFIFLALSCFSLLSLLFFESLLELALPLSLLFFLLLFCCSG